MGQRSEADTVPSGVRRIQTLRHKGPNLRQRSEADTVPSGVRRIQTLRPKGPNLRQRSEADTVPSGRSWRSWRSSSSTMWILLLAGLHVVVESSADPAALLQQARALAPKIKALEVEIT